MRKARVVIADPSPIFRSAVRTLLVREGDFEIREAATLDELLDAVEEADAAVVDLDLPPAGGTVAVRVIAGRWSAGTIVWSFEPAGETILAALAAGAWGYLSKAVAPDAFVSSLRGVLRGEAALAPELATLLVSALHRRAEADHAGERAALLSARERTVLELVAQGARNREIAAVLAISEFTVKRHVQNILQKLELPSRRAAAALLAAVREQGQIGGAA